MRLLFYRNFSTFFSILTLVTAISLPLLVDAQTGGTGIGGPTGGTGINPPTGGTGETFTLKNPLAVNSICGLVVLLLRAAMVIGIPIAVLFIVWAGFKFILARGSPGGLSEARQNFMYTLIGVAIFIGASLIANIIMATLGQLGVQGVTDCRFQ